MTARSGSEVLLERLGGSVQVVETGGGAGFAAAVNCGAAVASGDVLVILRDTPEVDAGWTWRPLVDATSDAVRAVGGGRWAETHPVESAAVAIARSDFTAVGGCPQVRDMYAHCRPVSESARHGRVVAAPGAW